MKTADNFTPEQRMRALLYFFGWQGGTIHQLASETGVDGHELLYGDLAGDGDYGFVGVRTCDREWRVTRLAPKYRGKPGCWREVIAGFWSTGPLDGRT